MEEMGKKSRSMKPLGPNFHPMSLPSHCLPLQFLLLYECSVVSERLNLNAVLISNLVNAH